MSPETLAQNFATVRAQVAAAAQRAGRDPASVTLVAVSKTHPAAAVQAAAALGQVDFGENRIEEAAPKITEVGLPPLRWHYIGHIQSRKARAVAEVGFAFVHSVDSDKLAARLSRLVLEAGRPPLPILLECNVSGEATKAGFAAYDPADWAQLATTIAPLTQLPGVTVRGLMTMAPIVAAPELARPYFRQLRALRDFLADAVPTGQWQELSMGMTDDFGVAIEEGATLVRVGRALFGERA